MSSTTFTRRRFLSRTLQTTALAAGLSAWEPLLAASGSRGFKIGACDWSIGKSADPTALDLAKQIGLDGVQVNMGSAANDMRVRKPEVQKQYREAVARTGLEIASLALGELNNVPLKSDPRAAAWLADSIDVCKALELPVVLIACFGKGNLDMANKAEIDHFVEASARSHRRPRRQGGPGAGELPQRRRQPPHHRPRRLAGRAGVLRRGQLDRQGF